jgi:hypothetical protein
VKRRGLVVALVAACGPVDDGPTSLAPVNACTPPDQSACARYVQQPQPVCETTGFCAAPGAIAGLTLVVSVPDSSQTEAANAFVFGYYDPARADKSCPATATCLILPPLGQIAGTYSVSQKAAQQVKFGIGTEQFSHSLPVRATFRPAFSFEGDPQPRDATLLGLDFQPVFALPVTAHDVDGQYPGPGFGPSPAQVFQVTMPHGSYQEELEPLPPFDEAFPPYAPHAPELPLLDNEEPAPRVPTQYTHLVLASVETPVSVHEVAVSRAGGLDLEGWTLFLRDDVTKRRVSSIARLHGPGKVDVNTVAQTLPGGGLDSVRTNVSLVLAPPAVGDKLPELAHEILDGVVPNTTHYPLLAPTVKVSGFVAGADGTRVAADIVLESTEIEVLDEDGNARDLVFVDEFQTDAQGNYARQLPPGKYKAIITPLPSSPDDPGAKLTKSIVDVTVSVPQSDADRVQPGRTLTVLGSVNLTGTCVTTDGRPVADAEVVAYASASLRYAANDEDRDALRWPLAVRSVTNAQGDFSIIITPRMTYDVVVRPSAGTRFPWVIVPRVTASPDAPIALPPIQVPAPVEISAILKDAGGYPLDGALVRAFKGFAAADPNNPTVAVEIGRGRTDENGRLELFLDGRR